LLLKKGKEEERGSTGKERVRESKDLLYNIFTFRVLSLNASYGPLDIPLSVLEKIPKTYI